MDSQDQIKTSLSGHENHGVHLCHKCGWPFPNPHPSAKHRRAHKRICGTIEGYKLIDSDEHTHLTVSDDEQVSDEDRETPSPKIEKRSFKGIGSGGAGERSNRSEDELFSDAVTEFSDSGFSPGLEERLEGGRGLDKNMEKIVEGDLNTSQSLKAVTTADAIHPPSNSTDTTQMHNPEVLETATNQLGSITLSQDIVPSCIIDSMVSSASDSRTEELAVGNSTINGSACDLSPNKSETLTDAAKEYRNANVGDNGMQYSMMCVGQETDVKGNEENNVDKILSDVTVPAKKTASKASEADSNLQEMDGKSSSPVIAEGIIESKEEQSDRLGPKMSKYDLSPQVESVEHMEAFVNTVQVQADSAQDIDVDSHAGLGEVCNTKGEGNEDMHVLLVANDLPIVDRPDIMIEDFKDHKAVKSNLPLTLGSGSMEDDNKGTVYEDSHSSFHSSKPDESIRISSADVNALEDKLEQEGEYKKPVIQEVPVEGEADTSELKVRRGEDLEFSGVEDHKAVKSNLLLTLGSGSVEDDNKDKLKQEGEDKKPVIQEVPIEGEADASELKVTRGEDLESSGLEDHKAVKSNLPLTLGSGSVEDDNKDTAYEDSHSNFHSSKLDESIKIPSADANALEDKLEQEGEGKKPVIEEVPVEGEADTSELKVMSSEDLESSGVEAPLGTSRTETQKIQTNRCLEELQPHDFDNDSSHNILPESSTMDLSDVIPMVTSVDDEVNHTTNLSGGDNADYHEMDKLENCDTAGNDSREGVVEEKLSANTKTPPESADDLSVSKVDQNTKLLGQDTSDHGKARTEFSDIAGEESTEAAPEEKCAMITKTTLESACHISESQVVADDGVEKVARNLQETESTYLDRVSVLSEVGIGTNDFGDKAQTHSTSQNCPDGDSKEAIKVLEINNDNDVLTDCVGAVSTGAESNHDGYVEVLQKNSENPNLKDPESSLVDSEFTTKSSTIVEDSHGKDGGSGVSGVSSEPLQEEGDDNLTKQHVHVSAVDISVDSSSQTDSLEGNWGSVSVLSTQSDAPAAVDAEALPSTDSQAPENTEKANMQMPKIASKGRHSDKSDVFDPPSFMTLVESEGGMRQKAAASEIQTVQTTQQPKSEALQAGWFPSLTNVVNESQGRKKNEEIINKVTNWSPGKQHTPLKNLLGEASLEAKPKSPNPKQGSTMIQKDETSGKNNGASATTVNSIMGPEALTGQAANRETGKEWNSPARYPPTDNKKDKRKVKGKPYWVPFVCCSSVN